MNTKEIQKAQVDVGQPVEITGEDLVVDKIVKRVKSELLKTVCRRCMIFLKTEEEIKNGFCDDHYKLHKEQLDEDRRKRETQLSNNILATQAEIDYKEKQISSGNFTETLLIITGSDGKGNIHESFKDGTKPEFQLNIEIRNLEENIKGYQHQIENMKKAMEDENARIANTGDSGK